MNKYFRFILPAVAVIVLSGAASSVSAQGVLAEILKRMDNNNKSLVTLKSNIKMAKTDTLLGETDISVGELTYRPGRDEKSIFLRINWKEPVAEELAVANGEYVLYRPKLKQAIVGKVDKAKGSAKTGGALAFMTMTKAQLRANYDVKYVGDETVGGTTKTFHLLLTPKKVGTYKSADLWVDKDGMPVQAKIVDKNNDTTTVLLTGVDRNPTVNASAFKISPPKGTAIVKG